MTISDRAYARHRKNRQLPGATTKSIRAARNSGRLQGALDEDGAIISAELADAALARNTDHSRRPVSGPTSGASDPDDGDGELPADVPPFAVSRARKEAAQAELAERQLARDKGEFIDAAKVRRDIERENAAIRSRILGVPSKLATHLSREEHRRIAPLVKTLVCEALDQLADEDINDDK